jgi:predicted ATPase
MRFPKIPPPFLIGSQFRDPDFKPGEKFPFNLVWLKDFELQLDSAVTFFVGENGSGKSTLLEAIASLCGLPVSGGGIQDAANVFGPEKTSELAKELSPVFIKRPRDGYFFRAEFYAQFASLLEQRADDPEFAGDPYQYYGGRSLHTRSHGESFLELMQNRLGGGLYLMDEPESALSPQRQLTLLAMIADRVKQGKSQFVIATHSPVLLTYPGATILSFDGQQLEPIELEETSHYTITKGILERPESYWKHLVDNS